MGMVLAEGGGRMETEFDQNTLYGLFKELINTFFEVDTVQTDDAKRLREWAQRRGEERSRVCFRL